jgi:hypothetical protein
LTFKLRDLQPLSSYLVLFWNEQRASFTWSAILDTCRNTRFTGDLVSTEDERQKRTPFSAKVPQASLEQAIPVAQALADLGAAATSHLIAQKMGTTYASSKFKTRLASAGYYGLTRVEGDKRALTPRGEAAISDDPAKAQQARREAVMSTSFGPIINSLRSRPVKEEDIAFRLQGDLSVPEASSPYVAKALVESAAQAGLIANNIFDTVAIEGASHVMPSSNGGPQPPPAKRQRVDVPSKQRTEDTRAQSVVSDAARRERDKEAKQERPFVPPLQVIVNIDASGMKPAEVAALVQALQAPASPSPGK